MAGEIEKPYLLTGGVGSLFENRHGLALDPDSYQALENVERDYVASLGRLLNGHVSGGIRWKVDYVSNKNIDGSLRDLVLSEQQGNPLIGFDDVCCFDLADNNYSVTRLMDPNNLEKGTMLGPRFGDKSLLDQARHIRDKYGEKIDVVDIGVFEGETLVGEIEERFAPQGVHIENVYVAFAGSGAKENLAKYGTKLHSCWDYDWIEWLEIRDCLGLDGRKILMEDKDHNVLNSFVPYTIDPGKWASIPGEHIDSFNQLYFDTFEKIRGIVSNSGHKISLEESKEFKNVLDLRVI